MSWGREPPKSLAMTKAPKRSGGLVLEAVWCVGAGGLGQTASGTWAGTAHRSERALPVKRGMAVFAHRH